MKPVIHLRVHSANHVRPCFVNRAVDHEGRLVDSLVAPDNFAIVVNQNQITRLDMAKVLPKGIDPVNEADDRLI